MAENLTGINFKGTPELKEAIRRAAFQGGFKNSSELMVKVISINKLVKTELEKMEAEGWKPKKK
jgi:hypothetical protein